ncbi:MAG: hypothetical protein RMJ66_07050, partial [Bacteroidia bacterium]|nr:hypothetical protein [Bacteroidia bacterium]MDW8134810.1 hypothetical protein [Bacteroidia bacterium]
LETYTMKPITQSRQHYLRFFWPNLLQDLVEAGIKRDYTLAFPKRSGFLLGTTLPVPAYRADKDKEMPLLLIGPALMDQVFLKRGDEEGLKDEIKRLFRVVKPVGGILHYIWHNSTWDRLPLHLFTEEKA